MHPLLKRCLHWAGAALGLAGVIFVAKRMFDSAGQIEFSSFGTGSWAIVAVLSVIFGFANCLLALGWWHILFSLHVRTPMRWAVRTYGISQLAKYVPGNVFHFASRQALGLAAGLPGGALVKSILWELVLASVAGVLFAVLALPLQWSQIPVPLSLLVFVSAFSMVGFSAHRWLGLPVVKALGCSALFLLLSSFVFVSTLSVVTAKGALEIELLPVYLGAYVVAWLAGLVTPGAPAGVGVRELVLLFMFGGRVVEAELLLAVIISRAITVVGDVGFYAWASFTSFGRSLRS